MARIHTFYPRDLLAPAQAAQYAGVAESTIRQWVSRGLLEHAIPSAGRGVPALYNRPDLDDVKLKLTKAAAERQAGARAA